MVERLKYICTVDHFNGIQFKAGAVYMFVVAPAGDYASMFELFEGEVLSPGPVQGTIDLDGTWRPGPVNWVDFSFPALQGKQGANAKPDFDYTNIGYLFPQNDPTEILYVSKKLPAGMMIGPDCLGYPHSHWVQTAADQVPILKGDFRIVCDGDLYDGFTTLTSNGSLFTYVSGNLLQVQLFDPINLWDVGVRSIGGQVEVKGYRDDNDVVGDVLVKSFGMWIPMDSPLGSGTPTQK